MKKNVLVGLDHRILTGLDNLVLLLCTRLQIKKIHLQRLLVCIYCVLLHKIGFSVIGILVLQGLQELSLLNMGTKSYNNYIEGTRFEPFNIYVRLISFLFCIYYTAYSFALHEITTINVLQKIILEVYVYSVFCRDYNGTTQVEYWDETKFA
ncbi:hypothetical protein EVB94_236 [Rhizobium phage RHph_TM40]|uniref:Uncharacterized protein n=1 Tax=Rhizobium phage RHph_TM30 TaxID=2509764 RepID=A0A7S5UVH9_9CAUD|nr:hypothetical protein PQC16_gp236 [Rhizobium phage RHph_TM30]QIG71343.1 hypothetical protein EVB93_236 [Rhizobium phage RHph_TM30]QIG71707.1 hypothetical protein EVB94_236 [Rhizobium phage RHph_TM40]QIG72070.1 hypothetical protein EVB95_236 [Rhizobium phage RHph_TM2_3B]QIG72432.1 hypothetical protein EVB96_236 [Rhizobium phage RHph_TM3_3_6]